MGTIRISRFIYGNSTWMGRVSDDGKLVERGIKISSGDLMLPHDFFEGYATLVNSRTTVTAADWVSADGVVLLAPVPRPPKNIFCVGKNYAAHAAEFAASGFDSGSQSGSAALGSVDFPIVFSKPHTSISSPGSIIPLYEDFGATLDYEAEFAVLIGESGSDISRDDAWKHIVGLTLANDVTCRDRQYAHGQWLLGKSADGYLPIGPWLLAGPELSELNPIIECRVNGELRQSAPMSDMIFDIPSIIETISKHLTLESGDLIATGTPAGVGLGFEPPRFLRRGDVVSVTADGFGSLDNRVG